MVRPKVVRERSRGGMIAAGWLLCVLSLSMVPAAATGAISCRAQLDKTTARQGDVVVMTVTAEGDIGWSADFELPAMRGVNIAGGGTSQSVSMINGRTRATVSRTYYLTVTADRNVTIGPVIISAGQDHCATEPMTIKVSPGTGGQAIPPAMTGNRVPRQGATEGGKQAEESGQGGKPGDDVFITLQADRTEAYVGQQIILTFSYWRRVQPWNNPTYTPPRTEGFWREDLGTERNFSKVIRGRNYSVTQVRYALFPTRSGDLVIEPAELRFAGDVFDRFFGSGGRRRGPKVLRTDPVTIRVREVPEPRPAGFNGLVASDLQLHCRVDRDSVQTGDPVSLMVTLTADGFLKGFAGLTIKAPEGAKLHDATDSFETDIATGRLVGHITVEKILVPQKSGIMQVPPIELVWFDAGAKKFRTAVATVQPVSVGGQDLVAADGESSGFVRSGLTRLGNDLAFIHPVPRRLRRCGQGLVGGPLWWILLVLPVVLLILLKLYLEKVSAAGRDPRLRRSRRAWAEARRLLAESRKANDPVEACTSLARAVRGYVADRTGIEAAEVGRETVLEFASGPVSPEDGERLVEILDLCDSVRFGGVDAVRVRELVTEAGDLLEKLEKNRGGGSRSGIDGPALVLALAVLAASGLGQTALQAQTSDPVRLMAEGNQAYTAGNLDQAAQAYLEAGTLGVDDAALHFNLGNTYARQGKLGKAVACYLRARRLAPRDRDIGRNLAWVRENIRDVELTNQALPLFVAQAAAAVDFLTLDQWGVVVLALVWILCLLGAWGLRHEVRADVRRRILVGVGVLLVLAVGAAGWRYYQDEVRLQGVVIGEVAEVRSGPAESFPVLFEVHDGLTVNLHSVRQGWRRISLGGDWTGWVPADQVEAVASPCPAHGR